VTIQLPDYVDAPSLTQPVTGTDQKRAIAEADEAVVRAVDRISGQAMVSTANDSYGAFFIAYDPERETAQTMGFTNGLVAGSLFASADADGIVLGHILAENLGAKLGDKVVFTLTDRSGEIVSGMERLIGIVNTGASSTDAGLVLLPIDTVRKTIGYAPNESTQVALFLRDGRRSAEVAKRLGAQLGPDVSVLTWDQLQPEIKAFVAMKIGGGRVFELVIALLVAAGIFNTIFMSVLERTREFGILRAIGYSPIQIFALVIYESSFLAVLGLVGAIAVSAWPYYTLHNTGIDMTKMYAQQGGAIDIGGVGMDPILRIGIYPENAVAIGCIIVITTILAGVYPAWKAGRVSPIESINLV